MVTVAILLGYNIVINTPRFKKMRHTLLWSLMEELSRWVGAQEKFALPPAVICEHRLRASCEPKKIFCGHLRAA